MTTEEIQTLLDCIYKAKVTHQSNVGLPKKLYVSYEMHRYLRAYVTSMVDTPSGSVNHLFGLWLHPTHDIGPNSFAIL